jgi:hypothetical protein
MSTTAVQLVVSVSCQLSVPVASGDGDGRDRAHKTWPRPYPPDHSLRLSRLLLPLAIDNWHWQLSSAGTGN